MSFIHHDRNNEQMLIPITMIRGGTSRGFYFEGKNVPPQGKGLEEFVLAVRGSPEPMVRRCGRRMSLSSRASISSP
jgi:2-methylaconitate isomerase